MPQVRFKVKGRWPFPTDMLRYDEADAASPADQVLINNYSTEHMTEANRGTVTIELVTSNRVGPTVARWESFSWRVVSGARAELHEIPGPAGKNRESIHWRQIMREAQVYTGENRDLTWRSWEPVSDGPLFIRLESRSPSDNHQQFDRLIGKTVKITVEVLD